jgi:ATP-dependent exoDNAse (exonuclease V) beta subunit
VAIIVGNLIHQWFEHLSLKEINDLPAEPDFHHPLLVSWRSALKTAGLGEQQLSYAMRRLLKGLSQVREDEYAQFIFADRDSTQTELGVVAYFDNALRKFSIDRMFEHDGVLWIVDHKTTDTRETNLEQFVDQQVQQRHKKQLEAYGRLMHQIDERPIQLAVYFPLIKQLRSWSFSN